jgi:hypothetical protein
MLRYPCALITYDLNKIVPGSLDVQTASSERPFKLRSSHSQWFGRTQHPERLQCGAHRTNGTVRGKTGFDPERTLAEIARSNASLGLHSAGRHEHREVFVESVSRPPVLVKTRDHESSFKLTGNLIIERVPEL